MPAFAESPSSNFEPRRERAAWRSLLFVAAALGALAATRPWTTVNFVRLFGEVDGPPAWESTPGFTCLCTSALVAVMALAETHTRTTRQAVRPASLLLTAIMALAFTLHTFAGPGQLRGVSATWTWAFYANGIAAGLLLVATTARFVSLTARPATHSP